MFKFLCLLVALCIVQALAQTACPTVATEYHFYIPQRCYPLGIGTKAEYISLDNATSFSFVIYDDYDCSGTYQVDESFDFNTCYTQSDEELTLSLNYTLTTSNQLPLKNAFQSLVYQGGCDNQTEPYASITFNPDACFPADGQSYKYSCNETYGFMQLYTDTVDCTGNTQLIPFPLGTCLDSALQTCYNPSDVSEDSPAVENLQASQYLRVEVTYTPISSSFVSSFQANQFQEIKKRLIN